MTSITVYDGAETIGGNKIYVEEKGNGVFLDFGLNFAKYGKYFAEFLTERDIRGIYDLVRLNLIPELKIYRTDVIPADVDTSSYPELNVKALFLSHAHLDHCGNAGLLDEDISFIVSPVTAAILKAMRDISPSRLASEVAYFSRRYPKKDSKVLEANRRDSYCGRNFYHTKDFSDDFYEFMCSKPGQDGKNAKKLDAGEVCELCEKPLPFEVRAYDVDHSIYGATAYILEGDNAIAYTGDLRVHGKKGGETKKFVKNAKDVSILIVEGTRAGREDYHDSENTVYENCCRAVEQADGLIVADFAARNFERLEAFSEIAEKYSRELVITAKDAYMLYAIECADGICRMENLRIYEELRARKDKWESEVVEERWGERYTNPLEISKNPEQYILCFSFYDLKHILDINPEKGVYIYSSSEAFTEEQEFDFVRLNNWLSRFNFETYGFRMEGDKPVFEKGFHASGHVSKEDIRWIIETVDPDVVIPVHTDNSGWFEENFENVVVLRDGESYKLI